MDPRAHPTPYFRREVWNKFPERVWAQDVRDTRAREYDLLGDQTLGLRKNSKCRLYTSHWQSMKVNPHFMDPRRLDKY